MSDDITPNNHDTIDRSEVFAVYNVYRLVIGSVLLAILMPGTGIEPGVDDTIVKLTGAGILVLSGIVIGVRRSWSALATDGGIFGVMMLDVVATTLIADPRADSLSEFSALYFVTVAAASLLLTNRTLATLVAALTVLAILTDAVFFVFRGQADSDVLLYAGLLGVFAFLISWSCQIASARLMKAERVAAAAESTARQLRSFNEQIVEQLQTGILLVTHRNGLIPVNAAGRDLLALDDFSERPAQSVDPQLALALDEWRDGNTEEPAPFKPNLGYRTLLPRFVALDNAEDGNALVFVDDYTPMTQFAQSLKLTSLGRLTGSIAHEIRNPLAAVSNAVQLLAENDQMTSDDRELANIVLRNTHRMNDTVSNVLEMSRRVPPKFESVDLNVWVPWVVNDLEEARSDQTRVTLEGTCTALISVDGSQLKRVMENLLDNAFRHSDAATGERSAVIQLSDNAFQRRCFIDVIDNGEGVPESAQPRLFEPFFTTRPEGTGLGLYLCKELCESNGVGISYRRTDDGRSSFRLSLRMQPKEVR